MKSLQGKLNIKRIATIAAGAALLGMGIAFASPVTFQNVPVISNSGQPVVQIVVGSSAKPSDGVAAANIAAAIGNLAYTSVPVTATVNASSASKLGVAVSSSNYTLSNAQVWLNESGTTSASGSFAFTSLIGSVLNLGTRLGIQFTKTIDTTGSYSYLESNSLTISPVASPYSAAGSVPTQVSVSSNSNGGGISFSSFTSSKQDNILRIGNTYLSGLANNWGTYGENEYLWVTGFPVYDQQSGVNNFALLDANGAYQVTFNKPIPVAGPSAGANVVTSGLNTYAVINNAQIVLLGQNWTIVNALFPLTKGITTNVVNGGKLQLAQSLSPLTTVYVGHNLTSGPWTVVLPDLGQPNSNGVSPADLNVYYNGQLTNITSAFPGTSLINFNVTGHQLYVKVNQTFAGLYAYQKYAKLQVFANTYNITDGKVYNQSQNPNWIAQLLWVNGTQTSGAGGPVNELQSIIIYGSSSNTQTLTPGKSISFITMPAVWKLQFVGDTLGSSGYDALTATLSSASNVNYADISTTNTVISNVTEPAQELTVTSQIPNAFSYAGTTSSSVVYDLTPYSLSNAAVTSNTQVFLTQSGGPVPNVVVVMQYNGLINAISSSNPLTVQLSGFSSNSASSATGTSVTFTSNNAIKTSSISYFNITSITLQTALPGAIEVNVIAVNAPLGTAIGGNVLGGVIQAANTANYILIGSLASSATPQVLYGPSSGKVYYNTYAASGGVIYNQQNGQPTTTFTISNAQTSNFVKTGTNQYFTFSFNEVDVPTNTASTDQLGFGIQNSTAGVTATPLFQLNYSLSGTHNNVSYTSSQLNVINAQQGFRTERGSTVASITPTSLTFDLAKSVDTLQFIVGPVTSNVVHSYTIYPTSGPGYKVGQATNIPNVSIYKVTGTPVFSGNTAYTITGISNLTATPSVKMATQPVLLSSLTTTPLAVLDANANANSNLILVGSGYVNSLSKQVESAYNVSVTPGMGNGSGYLVQAYGTNRIYVAGYSAGNTTHASNVFIQDLYTAAAGH